VTAKTIFDCHLLILCHPERSEGSTYWFFAGPTVRHRKTKRPSAAQTTGGLHGLSPDSHYIINWKSGQFLWDKM